MLEEITAYDFYKNNKVENDSLGCTTLIMPDERFTFLNFPYINSNGDVKDFLGRHIYTAYEILKEQYNLPIVTRDLYDINDSIEEASIAIKKLDDLGLRNLPKKISDRIRADSINFAIEQQSKYDFGNSAEQLDSIVPGGLKNIIMISYVFQDGFQFVPIKMPSYITSYQAEQLEEVNEELKKIKQLLKEQGKETPFLIGITVEDFNPLTHKKDESIEEFRINNDTDGEDNIKEGKISDPIKYILEYMKVNGRINDNIENSFRKNIKVGSRTM